MKIYKNSVCVKMELDEFLEILESDMIDELIEAIIELDEAENDQSEEYNLTWFDENGDDEDFFPEELLSILGEEHSYAKKPAKMSEEDRKLRKMIELFYEEERP